MATLPYGTYANPTTPLWATANAGQQFVSPSEVTNDLVPPTAEITTFVNNDITGSFTLNTIPAGTPLNEIKLEGASAGISLYTNGQPTLVSTPNITSVLGDLEIVSKQTGGTWEFNNNQLSYNGAKQLTGDTTYSQLGNNTYSDSFGLNVWNVNSSNKTTTLSDREIYFSTTVSGATTTNTYDFVSPLVPNRTTADPLVRNPNSRTPIFPEDAYIGPLNGDSSLVVSPSAPYSVQCTNTNALPRNVGSRLSKSSTPNDWIRGTDLPFWIEVELFDPASTIYGLYNGSGAFGQTALLDNIQNVAGTLSFVPLGALSPTTFTAGDSITIVYEWIDIPTGQAQVLISKNNVLVSSAPVGITFLSSIIPQFYSLVQVVNGFTYTLPSFNWGRVSPVLTSFNEWEWTTGLGGLYPRGNTALSPALTGTNPPSNLYDSVFMFGGCTMTSPPISAGVGATITIAGYKGSKLGSGTLSVYQNSTLLITTIVSNQWSSGNIITCTSTGSDTIKFVYTSATDILSLQRIQISYASPVDALDGGMGMNGTNLNIGAGDYYSLPTIQMNSSLITLNKTMNANNYQISNVNTLFTSTLSPYGSAIFLGGNISGNNNNISNINSIRATRLDLNTPQTSITIGGALDMLANNISNAGTITSTSISNSSDLTSSVYVATPSLTSINAGTGLLIGFSNTAQVNIDKTQVIQGTSISNGMEIKLCEFINGGPACATGSVWYVANFFGLKQLSCPLPPSRVRVDGTAISLFSSPDDYVSTVGYTLPPYSTIDIFDSGTIIHTNTNNTNRPQTYANTDFILDNPARSYRLTAYLDIV
jgi:hypothetical protein